MLSHRSHPPQREPQGIAPKSGTAFRLAELSRSLMPLMAQHDILTRFAATSEGGLCVADATRNPTNAYKIRGALARVSAAQSEGKKIVVTASAGNHGAGVACAAQALGMEARVYVPESAPQVKVNTIRGFGATVLQEGSTFDESLCYARRDQHLLAGRGALVHPFDDLLVAAGQGTIGLEMLAHIEQLRKERAFDKVRIFLPVGGGGLLAGVASVMKMLWDPRHPHPEIVGVIDESAPAALLGILFGRPVAAAPDTIADGTKVALIGDTFLSVSHLVDYMMLVRHDSIVSAMRRHERETFTKLEGAGALALAGEAQARKHKLFSHPERTLSIALITGRNIDPCLFHEAVTGEARLDIASHARQAFDVRIPEREGELLHFLQTVKSFNIASLTYKQRPGAAAARLQAEFEVPRDALGSLQRAIFADFPGSHRLEEGEEMLYPIGEPVAQEYHDELIALDDKPGAFLECVERLSKAGAFGSVGFLFYRKPPYAGKTAQVVLGLD